MSFSSRSGSIFERIDMNINEISILDNKADKISEDIVKSRSRFFELIGIYINEKSALDNEAYKISEDVVKSRSEFDKYLGNQRMSLDGTVVGSKVAIDSIKNAGTYNTLTKNLSSYNTMRGGTKGFKGFVFEDLHATSATLNGKSTEVISNNGLADFIIYNKDGTYSFGQAKIGYNSTNIDWSVYKGQDIVIDKGNTKLIESARSAGMNVIESDISKAEAQRLAKAMQIESKLTGKPNATIVPSINSYHKAGINSAKNGAAFGAGYSMGSNMVDLVTGDKDLGEVSIAIAKDTAVATAGSYIAGAGTTALANTTIGVSMINGATAAGSMIAGTSIGTTAIAATTAVTTAATGTASFVGGTLASTTLGAGAMGGLTAVTAAIGSTTVGAAAAAAAPVVLAGAALGGAVKIGKKILRRR